MLTAAGHGLMMRAYELVPAPVLAPLGYTEIVGATVAGLVLFGEFPDATTWLERFAAAGVPCAPIARYGEVLDDPQVEAYQWIQSMELEHGPIIGR